MSDVPFFPTQASTTAGSVDTLFLVETLVSLFFVVLIFGLILLFVLRYRRQSDDEVPPVVPTHYALEATWIIVPFAIMLVYFFWGADLYVDIKKPLAHAMEIHVVGKQWMWKVEYPDGVREINALHVPAGQPVKLVLSSQDVIHDFFIPEFRVKQDVVPGSFVTEWFVPTRVGNYHLFCAQYCGTDHAKMVGTVSVMTATDYQAWLSGQVASDAPAVAGAKLFMSQGCMNCHGQRAPTMAGLFGSRVTLQDGSVIVADENYIREKITNPRAKVVAGFPEIMPPFYQFSEEQIFDLVAYIKSLQTVTNAAPGTDATTQPLEAPSTRPAPGQQPAQQPNFPPAEAPYSPSTIQKDFGSH